MNPEGSDQRPLEAPGCDGDSPSFSPNGQWITFTSERDGNRSIWVMRADGMEPRRVTPEGFECWQSSFSPEGTQLVFTGGIRTRRQLHRIDADGADLVNLSRHDADDFAAHWGPELNTKKH